jgi:hypothetical protein
VLQARGSRQLRAVLVAVGLRRSRCQLKHPQDGGPSFNSQQPENWLLAGLVIAAMSRGRINNGRRPNSGYEVSRSCKEFAVLPIGHEGHYKDQEDR